MEGRVLETIPECGARCGVLRLRLVTAPREVRDTARQALRPGCEEHRCTGCGGNAADGSAAPAVNRHGGAPRGERPTLLDARRLASAWRAASLHARRMPLHPCACRRSAHPSEVGVGFKTRAQVRRGNDLGCLTS